MSLYSEIVSTIALILAFLELLYLIREYYLKKKIYNPTIEISIKNPPPYKDKKNDSTKVIMKNVGNSTAYDPKLKVWCSYYPNQEFIDYFEQRMILPEETTETNVRIPLSPYSDNVFAIIRFFVSVRPSKFSKKRINFEKKITTGKPIEPLA